MRSLSSRLTAIGFSHNTCAPCRAAASTPSTWAGCGVHTVTACGSAANTPSASPYASGTSYRRANARARSTSTSATATTSTPSMPRNAVTWLVAIRPQPMMPTRSGSTVEDAAPAVI
jgi:hypothetical protein